MDNKQEEIDSLVYKLKVVTQKQKEKIQDMFNLQDTISDIAELNQEIEELLHTLSILRK